MVRVRLQSGVVNAVIFVVIDIFAIWGIQRGLCALQALYLYRKAKHGYKVPLQQSRVPLIAGSLMRGTTPLPSPFIFANALLLSLVFLAALDVNGDKEMQSKPADFQFLTQLKKPDSARSAHLSELQYRHPILSCRRDANTILDYWPAAHSGGETGYECQEGVPGISPMLEVKDCSPLRVGCFGMMQNELPVNISLSVNKGLNVHETKISWRKINSSRNRTSVLPGSFVSCVRILRTSLFLQCLVIHPQKERYQYKISYARFRAYTDVLNPGNRTDFTVFGSSATIKWTGLLQDEILLLGSAIRHISEDRVPSISNITDSIVTELLGNMRNNNLTVYKRTPTQVTDISTRSIVIYSALAFLAVTFIVLKECILCTVKNWTTDARSVCTAFDSIEYDSLSRLLCGEMEKAKSVPASNEPALLLYKNGKMQITTPFDSESVPSDSQDSEGV